MTDKSEMLAKLLAEKCEWPCSCVRKWEKWSIASQRWEAQPPAQQELDSAAIELELVFACIAHRCPDKWARTVAMINLLHPVWSKLVPQAEARLNAADAGRLN